MEENSKKHIVFKIVLIILIISVIGILVALYLNIYGIELLNKHSNEGETLQGTEMKEFNENYTQYVGSQRGATVKSLIQDVIDNNSTRPELKIIVVFDGKQYEGDNILKELPNKIEPSSTYNVSVDFTVGGRVNKIIIE